MQNLDFYIRRAEIKDLEAIISISEANKSHKEDSYWDLCRQRLESEELWAYMAQVSEGDLVAGYGFLNWKPKYRVYEQLSIPEIQDLNVLSNFRRRGIAKAMIRECEAVVLKKGHDQIGISFGLTKEYGYAQRLYISLGYIPDGFGVTYDREPVGHGQLKAVDDNLCLMLVKNLHT